jgi:hypothetical protein
MESDGMAKSETPSFILTLPLKTELFQEHILNKCLEVSRQMYNSCLGDLYKRYNAMKRDKDCQEAITLPKGDKTKSKRLSALRSKYNISEYAMHKYITPMKNHYNVIDINTAQKIATRCYKAFKDVLFGKAKKAHFKKYGMIDSLEGKTNASGIRFKDNTVSFGKLKIPAIAKQKDIYAQECLTHRIKYCRIIKKLVNGKDKFYIQLILEGLPPVKVNPETGEFKHPTGEGPVGIDAGTQTVGIASKSDVKLLELASGLDKIDAKARRLQRKLDRSSRVMNPDNYNTDGTIKKGRRKWIRSNRYMEMLYALKELHRKLATQKKQAHNIIANYILSLGDEIYVENMNFAALAKRAKKTEVSEITGRFKRKKRFGKSILRKSPAMFLSIIDQKLHYQHNELHKVNTWIVKASQYCHLNDTYKKKPLSKRWNDFDGGGKIQRDMYSAFLLMCINPDLQSINRDMCLAEFDNFKKLHDVEVAKLSGQFNLSSMGIKKTA